MKNVFKLTVLALVLGVTGNAVAAVEDDQAVGTFRWLGALPAENVNGLNAKIVNTGTIDHQNGLLTFAKNATAGYDLTSSSELIFNVHTSTAAAPNTWTPATSFDYKLRNVQFSTGGIALNAVTPGAEEFHVKANSVAIPAAGLTGVNGDQKLTIGANGPLTTGFEPSSDVMVQATIFVTNAI